jgi:hypothetical protein
MVVRSRPTCAEVGVLVAMVVEAAVAVGVRTTTAEPVKGYAVCV